MTAFTTVDTRPVKRDKKVRFDQWKRYILPDPVTGEDRAWTRVTTIAGSVADRYGLERWDDHNIAWGIGQRPDLFARAAACKREDSDTLTEIVEKAKEAAAASSGAVMGSAIHEFVERLGRGEQFPRGIPQPMAADVDAYRAELERSGLTVLPEWIERLVCIVDDTLPEPIAGRMDGLCSHATFELPRVSDLKTGQDVERYGKADIPLQEALYAHATHWWDEDAEQWNPMPAVDQERALVFHVPAGQGRCEIKEVDIAAGWRAVQLALDVRAWRRRKNLFVSFPAASQHAPSPVGDAAGDGGVEPVSGDAEAPPPSSSPEEAGASTRLLAAGKGGEANSPAVDPPAPASSGNARLDWLRERVEAIKTAEVVNGEGVTPKKRLAGLWSLRDEIPTFPKGGPRNDDEIDVVAGMCDLVEMEFELPFGAADPTAQPTTKADRKADT